MTLRLVARIVDLLRDCSVSPWMLRADVVRILADQTPEVGVAIIEDALNQMALTGLVVTRQDGFGHLEVALVCSIHLKQMCAFCEY